MSAFGFAAIVFGAVGVALILYTLLYTPKASPDRSGATSSGRDGSHAATRTTAHADNPPGTPSEEVSREALR